MTDDSDKKLANPVDAENASKAWDVLASIGIGVYFGVPPPPSVIKSLRKAADKFVGGIADYGLTFVEEATAKRKSISAGKQLVLHSAAEAVAEKVSNDDKLIERAMDVFATDLIVKQKNKEKVFALAVSELNVAKSFDESEEVIDDDWLGIFSTLASQRSNEDVQQLLAKILEGEIRRPGSFSPLTLHVLSTLNPTIAKSFERFCNLTMEWEGNNKVSFLYHGSYSEYMLKGMPEFNLGYGDILVLQNYGLLLANIDAIFFLSDPILESKVEIGGALLSLKSKNGTPIKVQIANVSPLSIAGHELRSIISLEVPPAHLQKQIEFLNVLGFEVISP